MPVRLVDALAEMLAGWQDDLPRSWRPLLADVELGLSACDTGLELEFWEPIFPVRRGSVFPGAPQGAHMLAAFDGISPQDVRCVVLGQDPYPEPAFATGRAFEAGNIAAWRELDKMFSKSVRAFLQLICAARSGNAAYARSFADWPGLLADIEGGRLTLESPGRLADRWIRAGVLLLNSSLTLSRFRVEIDPHQSQGHLPVWRPLIHKVLASLARNDRPVVFIGFGDVAAETLRAAGLARPPAPHATILRAHPAFAEKLYPLENPFIAANRHLVAMGEQPISW